MAARRLQVGVHGGCGEIGVAAFDGIDDVAMRFDGAFVVFAGAAVGPGKLDAAFLQAVEHGRQDPVAGGLGDGEVEIDVRRAEGVGVGEVFRHVAEDGAQPLVQGGIVALGGQPCAFGF